LGQADDPGLDAQETFVQLVLGLGFGLGLKGLLWSKLSLVGC
jgi:hypothetical protein